MYGTDYHYDLHGAGTSVDIATSRSKRIPITSATIEVSSGKSAVPSKLERLRQSVLKCRAREARLRREMKSSERTIKKKDRLIDKWKRKYYRLQKKTNPRGRDELLDSVKDIERKGWSALRKKLLQAAAIQKQLFDKRKTLKNNREKSLFAQALSGETLKKISLCV